MTQRGETDSSLPGGHGCIDCGLRLSFVNLLANLGLAMLKALVGVMAGSRALVAAALYSVNDVLSAVIVIGSLKVSRKPADDEHPFGHGMVEFLAIAVLSIVIAGGVVFILYFSLVDIVLGNVDAPHSVALFVAALSMGANWLLAERGFCVARALGSPALHSSAEHNRADAVSSFAVLLGVGCATFGLHVMDRVVALFEALHILWLGGSLFGKSLRGLMDAALSPEEVVALRRAARRVDGVIRVVELRTRRVGSEITVDVIVAVSANLSVDDADAITRRVRRAVRRSSGGAARVQVGFQAEDAPPSTRRRRTSWNPAR